MCPLIRGHSVCFHGEILKIVLIFFFYRSLLISGAHKDVGSKFPEL